MCGHALKWTCTEEKHELGLESSVAGQLYCVLQDELAGEAFGAGIEPGSDDGEELLQPKSKKIRPSERAEGGEAAHSAEGNAAGQDGGTAVKKKKAKQGNRGAMNKALATLDDEGQVDEHEAGVSVQAPGWPWEGGCWQAGWLG